MAPRSHNAKQSWSGTIASAPHFYMFIGLIAVIAFLPLTFALLFEWLFHTGDLLSDAPIVLPFALAISVIILLFSMYVLIHSARYAAIPGSFLYRLTHISRGK